MEVDRELLKEMFYSLSLDEHKGDVSDTLNDFAPRFGLEMEYSGVQDRMVFTDDVYCLGCGIDKEEADEYYEGGCECDDEVFKPGTVADE